MESMIKMIKETILYVIFYTLLMGVFLIFIKILMVVSY